MTYHYASPEPISLLLASKRPDEEEPEASVSNSLKVTIEQTFMEGQLKRLKLSIVLIITASTARSLVKHLGADDPQLQDGDTLVKVVPVPAMLLDGAEGAHVVTGQTEHGLGALDWPEQALLLVLGHDLPPGHGGAPLHIVGAEHQAVLLLLRLQQLLGNGEVVGDVL